MRVENGCRRWPRRGQPALDGLLARNGKRASCPRSRWRSARRVAMSPDAGSSSCSPRRQAARWLPFFPSTGACTASSRSKWRRARPFGLFEKSRPVDAPPSWWSSHGRCPRRRRARVPWPARGSAPTTDRARSRGAFPARFTGRRGLAEHPLEVPASRGRLIGVTRAERRKRVCVILAAAVRGRAAGARGGAGCCSGHRASWRAGGSLPRARRPILPAARGEAHRHAALRMLASYSPGPACLRPSRIARPRSSRCAP